MPPLRRSIDLEEACAFLEEAANGVPGARPAPVPAPEPREYEPGDVRDDLSMRDTVAVRDTTPCPVCGAEPAQRCRTDGGTLAFLHHARVSDAIY